MLRSLVGSEMCIRDSTNTVASEGDRSLYMLPTTGQDGYAFTVSNFASSAGSDVRASFDHRQVFPTPAGQTLAGSVRLRLYRRTVVYAPAQAPPACARAGRWFTDRNQNTRTFTGSWVLEDEKAVAPSTAWAKDVVTDEYLIPGTANATSRDFRVQVNSTRRLSSGAPIWISVDNVRLEEV